MSENIEISKSIIERAKIVSSKIDDEEIRKRTFALNIAANVTAEYLNSLGFDVDTNLSLYRISSFAKNLELADIYIGGVRLDVRVSFDGQIFAVPKIQEKFDANPEAYIVVNFKKGLDSVEVLGYIPNSDLPLTETNSEYRFYETSILKPINELKDFLSGVEVKQNIYSVVEHEKIKELCVAFIDDEISESEKVYFIKHVVSCPVCRETFCSTDDFDSIVTHVKSYEELLNDSTLSVLSGNKEEVDMVALANMAYVENAEEIAEEKIDEQDNLQDIDELSELNFDENDLVEFAAVEEEVIFDEEEKVTESVDIETSGINDEENLLDMLDNSDDLVELNEEQKDFAVTELSEDTLFVNEEEVLSSIENSPVEDVEMQEQKNSLVDFEQEALEENNEELNLDNEEIVEEINSDDELSLDDNVNLSIDKKNDADLISSIDEQDAKNLEVVENFIVEEVETLDIHEESEEYNLVEHDEEDFLVEDGIDILQEDSLENKVEPIVEDNVLTFEDESLFEDDSVFEENSKTEEKIDSADEINIEDSEEPSFDKKEDLPQESGEVVLQDNEVSVVDNTVEEQKDETEAGSFSSEELNNENEEIISNEFQADTDEEKSELDQLLDDDLLALLSENNSDNIQNETDNTPAVEKEEEHIQEDLNEIVDGFGNENIAEQNEDINSLYEQAQTNKAGETEDFQLAEEPISAQTANATKKIVVSIALLLLLLGGGAVSLFFNNKLQNNTDNNMASDEEFFDLQNNIINKKDEMPAVSQDINKSMANSFSDKPTAITITKLSWQISEKLATEESVKEYLQIAGKNIQMNLQNDLMNSSDLNFNNLVKVSMEIAQDNTLKGLQILESSGSDQVDDIIIRSLKNTLKYVSVPKLKDFNSDYFLTLIINF